MGTSIRELINERIMQDIVKACRSSSEYKILVLDNRAAKILSSCCKMTDIMSENIMVIEDLMKKRQPMRTKDVIYENFLKKIDFGLESSISGRKILFPV